MDGPGTQGGWISGRAFAAVAVLAAAVSGSVFVWTIDRGLPEGERRARGVDASESDPSWGGRARLMYERGQYRTLIQSARDRIQRAPTDGEGWLFAALALEELGDRPGLRAMEFRAQALQVWEDLYERTRRPSAGALRNPEYFAGWALLGMGHPVMAREAFARHADFYAEGGPRRDTHYNRACYLALAGEGDAALEAWALAAFHGSIEPGWAPADPDLELIREDLGFNAWYAWTISRLPEGVARR